MSWHHCDSTSLFCDLLGCEIVQLCEVTSYGCCVWQYGHGRYCLQSTLEQNEVFLLLVAIMVISKQFFKEAVVTPSCGMAVRAGTCQRVGGTFDL